MVKRRRDTAAATPPLDLLDDASLRALAGDKTFARGVDYAVNGRVTFLAEIDGGAVFDVVGQYRYRTTLFADEVGIDAECACPSAEQTDFCKHAVAAALCWRARLGGAALPEPSPSSMSKAPSAQAEKAAATRAARRERMRAFIASQPAAELATRLWTAAERDASLMAELKAWEASCRANDDPKALREAAVELVADSRSRFLYGRDVSRWAARARTVEPLLRGALARSPEAARDAAEHALRRVYHASQHMDDSDGEVGTVIDLLVDVLIAALEAAPPAPSWAPRVLDLLAEDPYGIVEPDPLLDAAGSACARAFGRVVAERWDKLERNRSADRTGEKAYQRTFLRGLMLTCLQRAGDTGAVIDFMKRTARDVLEKAELIRWYDAHGRHREAIQLAQAACREHDNHHAVESLLLDMYERDGWEEEAFAIHERRFAERPYVHSYRALLDAAARASRDLDATRAWVYDVLDRYETQTEHNPRGRSRRSEGRDVTNSVELLLHDRKLDAALARVQPPNLCEPSVLVRLAESLPPAHDGAAFLLLDRVLHTEMARAQSPYHEALRVVALALARLDPNEAMQYRTRLETQYKAKRNFVSALPALTDKGPQRRRRSQAG